MARRADNPIVMHDGPPSGHFPRRRLEKLTRSSFSAFVELRAHGPRAAAGSHRKPSLSRAFERRRIRPEIDRIVSDRENGLRNSRVIRIPPNPFSSRSNSPTIVDMTRSTCRDGFASALVLSSLALAALGAAPASQADDGCGAGMYFNTTTNQCEYYAWVGPGPAGPGPVGPGPVGPGPVGPGPLGPGPIGPR